MALEIPTRKCAAALRRDIPPLTESTTRSRRSVERGSAIPPASSAGKKDESDFSRFVNPQRFYRLENRSSDRSRRRRRRSGSVHESAVRASTGNAPSRRSGRRPLDLRPAKRAFELAAMSPLAQCLKLLYLGTPRKPSLEASDVNMNVSLPEELANFVKDKVSTGRYGSSSEVVREALRLMERTEQQEAEKLALLRQAWKKGIDSGDAGEVDFTALKKEARARLTASKRDA